MSTELSTNHISKIGRLAKKLNLSKYNDLPYITRQAIETDMLNDKNKLDANK